jgi:hypothetical protein
MMMLRPAPLCAQYALERFRSQPWAGDLQYLQTASLSRAARLAFELPQRGAVAQTGGALTARRQEVVAPQ